MDSPRPEVDLEKELTCSICTELLYQPLTLLDCLHTFCGSCLKEWFSWQATAAENAPTPPEPGSQVFTCPSCRAAVRDTRHNATVATLLDMLLAANPDKARMKEEQDDMNKKYKPGEKVLPKLKLSEKTSRQRRLDEEERRLIEEVREMSLREAVAESSTTTSTRRRYRETRSRDGRTRRSRDPSREPDRENRARHARERARRQAAEDETRRRAEQDGTLHPENRSGDENRRRRSGERQRSSDSHETGRQHIEHQSSLRSLISSSNIDSRDIEREIEEFARQIQEEGLLDGLDLDNLDLSNNDELSRRITEAYRRRQRQRNRQENGRRSNASAHSHHSDPATPDSRQHAERSSRATSRQRTQSRSSSTNRQDDDRSRPPLSSASAHLEVQEPRRRRRTTSGSRSATVPVQPPTPEARVATRSQTDLALRTQHAAMPFNRPSITAEGRSSSSPTMSSSTQPAAATDSPALRGLPFRARASNIGLGIAQIEGRPATRSEPERRVDAPADLMTGPVGANFASQPASPGHDSPTNSPSSAKKRSQLYQEPSISCKRCGKEHIEYDLHYDCSICQNGKWKMCLDCYRRGKGCLHWFGFGYGAWSKWEKACRDAGRRLPEPHMLTANRYVPPKVIPGGAEGRQTLTTQNPAERLQSGTFCSRCQAWTNECFWRCEKCNDGDWGFCNDCVNQGVCCTHPLLPLAYCPPSNAGDSPGSTPPASPSPRSPISSQRVPRPAGATVQSGSETGGIGPFRPLTFTTRCDVCRTAIPPAQDRLHCFACTSSLVPDARLGDYDVCQTCYTNLVADGAVNTENGPDGWRRCPQGHRMVVIGFAPKGDAGTAPSGSGQGGQWRSVVRDLVGGRRLQFEPHDGSGGGEPGVLLTCHWFEADGRRLDRLVARDVRGAAGAATAQDGELTDSFPPDGGSGMTAVARWSWMPAAGTEDELMFPKGAEVREIEDANGEWFHGVYMGTKGLFPAPYVKVVEDGQA